MKNKQHIVGIYVRLSNDDERLGESASIENQKLLLENYVKDNGWQLKEIYADDGYSGTNQNRPAFQRMLNDIEARKINTIVVKDLSRIGRNYLEVGNFTEVYLPSMGCEIFSYTEPIDEMSVFRNWMNEKHSKDTSKKVKDVKHMLAREGNYLGTFAPYGYKKSKDNKHLLVIDEVTAPIVRKIFELRSQGKGFRAIACQLNEENIISPREYYYASVGRANPTNSNGLWNDVSVRVIIRNEVYIGNLVQGKTGTKSYKSRKLVKKPKEEWIKAEQTHEPLITDDLWQAVSEIDKRNYRPRTQKSGQQSIFSSLLYCADCGHKLRVSVEKGNRKDGSEYRYVSFACSNYAKAGKKACSVHTIYENVLHDIVLNSIKADAQQVKLNESAIIAEINKVKNMEAHSYLATYKQEQAVLSKRLSMLDKIIANLYEDRVNGVVNEEMFKEFMAKYEIEKKTKGDNLQEIKARVSDLESQHIEVGTWTSLIKDCSEIETLTPEILLTLIDKITVEESKIVDGKRVCHIHIYYKYVGNLHNAHSQQNEKTYIAV